MYPSSTVLSILHSLNKLCLWCLYKSIPSFHEVQGYTVHPSYTCNAISQLQVLFFFFFTWWHRIYSYINTEVLLHVMINNHYFLPPNYYSLLYFPHISEVFFSRIQSVSKTSEWSFILNKRLITTSNTFAILTHFYNLSEYEHWTEKNKLSFQANNEYIEHTNTDRSLIFPAIYSPDPWHL